jgi:hypothetical protein
MFYDRHPEPLTAKLKFELALRLARDPITPVGIAFVAGIRQAADSPNYQQNAKGYGQRFGVTAANGLTDIMLGSALLHRSCTRFRVTFIKAREPRLLAFSTHFRTQSSAEETTGTNS